MVLADHVQLAAEVLGRRLHPRQDVTGKEIFQPMFRHRTTPKSMTLPFPLYAPARRTSFAVVADTFEPE